VKGYLLSVGIPEHRLTTIYKGHDISWYDEVPQADSVDFGAPKDAFVVGFIGNMRPVKGITVLLESLHHIPEQIPIYVVCIGRVEDRQIHRLIRDPRIGPRAHLAGFVPRASLLAKHFDCMVMPSIEREGLPRAVIEAMAQEVPVVVSDAGGMPELVQDGHSGLVVPARDPHALARALVALYEDPARRRSLGKNGRTRIKESFNIQTTITEYIGLFERLVI
jgi:glycosyltransferase involved in cell wall biosynthesis